MKAMKSTNARNIILFIVFSLIFLNFVYVAPRIGQMHTTVQSIFDQNNYAGTIDFDDEDDAYAGNKESKSWWKGRHGSNLTRSKQDKELRLTHPHMGARHPNGTLYMIVDPSTDRLAKSLALDSSRIKSKSNIATYTITRIRSENRNTTSTSNEEGTESEKIETINNGHSINYDFICPAAGGVGIEGKGGNKVLNKVKMGVQKYKAAANAMKSDGDNWSDSNTKTNSSTFANTTLTTRKSRILCMVYTVNLPNDNHTNLRSIVQTWGRQCDGFFAASNSTDHSLGAIDLPHQGPEMYANMWQKIRTMWAYAYDNYRNDYDFFHIAGDDSYLVVDNLRAYVDGPEVRRLELGYVDEISKHPKHRAVGKKWDNVQPKPLYFGTPMSYSKERRICGFPAGGPGYTMNRAALALFGTAGLEYLPNATDAREDLFVGSFFCGEGVFISNTLDKGGGRRYLALDASDAASYREGKRGPDGPRELKSRYGLDIAYGADSVSEQGIAFHVKNFDRRMARRHTSSDLMRRYHAIVNGMCDE